MPHLRQWDTALARFPHPKRPSEPDRQAVPALLLHEQDGGWLAAYGSWRTPRIPLGTLAVDSCERGNVPAGLVRDTWFSLREPRFIPAAWIAIRLGRLSDGDIQMARNVMRAHADHQSALRFRGTLPPWQPQRSAARMIATRK